MTDYPLRIRFVVERYQPWCRGTQRKIRGRCPSCRPLFFAMHVVCLEAAGRFMKALGGERFDVGELIAELSEVWGISEDTGRSYVRNSRFSYPAAAGLVKALQDVGFELDDILRALSEHMPTCSRGTYQFGLVAGGLTFNVLPLVPRLVRQIG